MYPSNLLLLTGLRAENEVKIMHTSTHSSPFGDGSSSMRSTGRGCVSGVEAHKPSPMFQSSANPVLAETFERHWQQLRGIAAHNVSL